MASLLQSCARPLATSRSAGPDVTLDEGGGIDTRDGGRRSTIGFLAPAVHGYFWGNVLTGILRRAAVRGGRVIAVQTFDAGLVDYPDDDRFTARLAWQHLDALIVGQASVTDDYLREFAATGRPVIAVYRTLQDFYWPTVIPDNRDGVRLAIDHLIEHGHRAIVFVCRDRADADETIRYHAYREIMLARGLQPGDPVTVSWQLDETYDATAAVRELQRRGPLPRAAVACTDLVAMAFVEALGRIGIRVPGDLAVIGFDDVADEAAFRPSLSTVAQNFTLAGAMAGDLAFEALAGAQIAAGYHCTPVTFVGRESCGCADPTALGLVAAQSSTDKISARLVDELVEAGYGGRRLTPAQHRNLTASTDQLGQLFTAIAGGPDTGGSPTIESVLPRLRRLAAESSNPLRLVDAIRRFAEALARQLAPTDPAAAARCDRRAFDLALRLLENQNVNLRGRPIARQNLELQRRYYMIGTDLVRRRAMTAEALDWLAATEFRAGCLALWEGGRGNRDGGTTLRIVSCYDKAQRYPEVTGSYQVSAFPPASFVDLLDELDGEFGYLYLLPVRFAGSDWGFLALTGPLDVREAAAFERYNHWAVLLTVALDHEHAIRSEHALLEEIRASEERYALAAEAANDGLWDWNLDSQRMFYSSRWKALLGYAEGDLAATADEWLGRVHPDDRAAVDEMLARHFDGRAATTELEYRLRTADGSYRWMLTHGRSMRDAAGRVTRLVGSMTDVTDRKLLEERLRHDAHFDPLTGLPNRTLFLDRLNQAIKRRRGAPGYRFAVVFLDLDGFKVINDSLGHQVGDEVLCKVAARLTEQLRAKDTVARFGGDEFVLLLEDIHDVARLPGTVSRILSVISAPLTVEDRTLTVSAAAGIAASGRGHSTADDFLRDADTAMYQAKAAGNGSVILFDQSMHAGALRRLQTESDLRQAIVENQFELYYQPILRLRDREVVGAEALIRWCHPEHGTVGPRAFLPVAETTGLIREIGHWTIQAACRQISASLAEVPAARQRTVSINLSNRQFWDPKLRQYVRQALADFGVPASMLVFEVTEGVIMHNLDAASTVMRQIHEDAIKLHLDDFGTGHSSLAALHRFPIDAMKIDRSFISRMNTDSRSRELVRIMIDMGLSLGIQVIAEGIETEHEAEVLADLGCPLVQGFLFARPAPTLSGTPGVAAWGPSG